MCLRKTIPHCSTAADNYTGHDTLLFYKTCIMIIDQHKRVLKFTV